MIKTSYGFDPQRKAEGIGFQKEKSSAVVIGTNPGFHNGVLIIHEDGDMESDGEWVFQVGNARSHERNVYDSE